MKILFLIALFIASTFAQSSFLQKDIHKIDSKFYEIQTQELITGTVILKYKNGNISKTLNVIDGIPHGLSKGYYPTGELKTEFFYKDGKVDGIYRKFYKSGELYKLMTFEDDKLDKTYEYNKEGTVIKKNLLRLKT